MANTNYFTGNNFWNKFTYHSQLRKKHTFRITFTSARPFLVVIHAEALLLNPPDLH